jgi:hypothetical protein
VESLGREYVIVVFSVPEANVQMFSGDFMRGLWHVYKGPNTIGYKRMMEVKLTTKHIMVYIGRACGCYYVPLFFCSAPATHTHP